MDILNLIVTVTVAALLLALVLANSSKVVNLEGKVAAPSKQTFSTVLSSNVVTDKTQNYVPKTTFFVPFLPILSSSGGYASCEGEGDSQWLLFQVKQDLKTSAFDFAAKLATGEVHTVYRPSKKVLYQVKNVVFTPASSTSIGQDFCSDVAAAVDAPQTALAQDFAAGKMPEADTNVYLEVVSNVAGTWEQMFHLEEVSTPDNGGAGTAPKRHSVIAVPTELFGRIAT